MIKVEHKIYGNGVARRSRFGGYEYLIDFADGVSRWIRRDALCQLGEPEIQPRHKLSARQIPQEQFLARKAIEALRLGIVPHDSLENFTIGRDKEIREITRWFDNDKKGSLFIRGEYGSGKSHLLEYTRIWALKNGWATAAVEIGMEENPFFKPNQLYKEIVRSFRCNFEGKQFGFRDLIKYIIQQKNHDLWENHPYFESLSDIFRDIEEKELAASSKHKKLTEDHVWDWIEGEQNWFKPSLSQSGTAANLYCFLLNAISWSITNLLNLKGLVILFDEAEHIDEISSRRQADLGKSFLNGIIALAENSELLLKEKISSDSRRGYKTGLVYSGYPRNNPLRYAWKFPSCLKVIFAMTPVQEHSNMLDLQMLKSDDLLTIIYNVAQFYKNAYGFEVSDETVNRLYKKLPRLKTRLFIKACVEALDILRFNPEIPLEKLLKRTTG